MKGTESPGSIRNQLGRGLNAIRDNVEQVDVPGVMNHTRLMKATLAPFFSEEKIREYKEIPPESEDTEEQFEFEMQRIEFMLRLAADNKQYAFLPDQVGDGSLLSLGDGDDDEDAE